mmetsp:Transcript_17282/g.36240  ORF Transcript_17282/g.36240 Transcript_17282/m.36240 type:complete len:105 (+) Transcript_17282:2208-2522(+)
MDDSIPRMDSIAHRKNHHGTHIWTQVFEVNGRVRNVNDSDCEKCRPDGPKPIFKLLRMVNTAGFVGKKIEENVEKGRYASTEKRTDAEEGQRQDGGRHNDRQQE